MSQFRQSIYNNVFFFAVILAAALFLFSPDASASVDPLAGVCEGGGMTNSQICQGRSQKLFGPGSPWNNIVNTMIFIVGAAAVLMIVVGGLRYVMSNGDSGKIKSAKDTVMYAVIGIIVAVSSYAIFNFVLARI